ncbi:MAG: T9SS type A sorting domain-containing protein [Ignavibacteriae bacterium]|nr:T9SS type A sorting domain-containing protein [Ignavibacteriota bacterium]MCB9242146.1 T9SS type A sorting domain-containing protein [Ignavibacteriales bacterium]
MRIYLLILIFSSTSLISNAQNGWVTQNSGTTNDLWCVQFINETTGFCSGEGGIIIKTTNGGSTWFMQVTGTSDTLFCIQFPNLTNDTGYACGSSGTLRKTTNGGINWFSLPSGITQTIKSVFFNNANTGYYVGYQGEVRKTTNGGINWNPQISGTTANLWSICFLNQSTGWLAGFTGKVRKTTNGGINWFSQGSFPSIDELLYIKFLNANTGIVTVGVPGTINFYQTSDGGTTWSPKNYGTLHSARCIDYITDDVWMMSGDAGDIFRTDNGGLNWACVTPPGTTTWFFSTDFVTTNKGWVVGRDGKILYTSTGGSLAPAAPSNLLGFPLSTSSIYLTWFDNSSNEQGFKIERSLSTPDNFQVVGTTGANAENFTDNSGISPTNLYYYRVYAFNGASNSAYSDTIAVLVTGNIQAGNSIPDKYKLYNNYPNPFNPSTKIKFDLSQNTDVRLTIYDMRGSDVQEVINTQMNAGSYEFSFNGANLSSGVYFYRLTAGNFVETKQMVLVK